MAHKLLPLLFLLALLSVVLLVGGAGATSGTSQRVSVDSAGPQANSFGLFPNIIGPAAMGAASGPPDPASPTPTPMPAQIEAPFGADVAPLFPVREGVPPAPGLVSSANAPAISTGFAGIGMEFNSNNEMWTPPDTHAAVSSDRVVEVTNGHVAIYNKSGTLLAGGDSGPGAVDLIGFCEGEVNGCFDPKVIYDQGSERFVAVVLEVNNDNSPSTSFMHIMVSKDSLPGNLTTEDWGKFRHGASATIGSTDGWSDYPGLGVSPDALVITTNIFSASGSFLGTKIRVYDKAELYDNDATATYVDIDDGFLGGSPSGSGFTIQPAHHFGSPPAGTFYLFQGWNTTYLRVVALTGVPSSPAESRSLLSTADQGVCVHAVPQKDTTKKVDTVCPRMMNAVWRDGSLWGTLTGSDPTDSRAVLQWFEVETNGFPSSTPTLRQHGTIDAGTGEHTFMPSIAVNACGNTGLTYTQSSSERYPEMRYTGRLAADSLNTMQTPAVAKTSISYHDDFWSNPLFERWGDYSATVIDPSDQSFWIANEYVKTAASGGGNNGRWGTWIARFELSGDQDCDGFTDEAETLFIGTNAAKPCGSTGWPADLADHNNRLNIGDINSFVFPLRANSSFNKYGHPVPDPDDANIARWNLDSSNPANAAIINIGDLNAINPGTLAATARPPMFGGQPAFFADAGNGVGGCPFPP